MHKTYRGRVWRAVLIAVFLASWPAGVTLIVDAAELPEVWQLVTFKFEPGRTQEAVAIFREYVLPVYQQTKAMLRFRAYREVESPEPLDLVVISTFQGMAGMDESNAELVEGARKAGTSLPELYGAISDMSHHHHDQFVEIMPRLSLGDPRAARLLVLESIRVTAGARKEFEDLLTHGVRPWEKSMASFAGSETALIIIGDGWDYLRILGFDRLAEIHAYDMAEREQPWALPMDRLVDARKRVVLREEPALAVR